MFTFLIQTIDLVVLDVIGLFLVFFVLTWAIHLIKLAFSLRDPLRGIKRASQNKSGVTAIIPVVLETHLDSGTTR